MANYHLNISYGKVGKGASHVDYILGENKYFAKQKEILYSNHDFPEWADSPKNFWKSGDEKERVNGIVYKEIRISLPNELSEIQNIELLNQFLEKLLENKYHYSVAIHSKESSYKNEILNIHAHIMFCTREKDEI
ncbi:MAG: MobA/MobL family protein, partial [Cetobacterium sp.]